MQNDKNNTMKMHYITHSEKTYAMFYDTHLRLWTSYEIDSNEYQIGNTEYWVSKGDALAYLKEHGTF
jgi:hypothetical protein